MQDHEHEREQDPAHGSGGDQPPTYGTGSQEPPYGPGSQQPGYAAASQQPGYGPGSQQPAYGASQQPGYGAGGQQPGYGASSQQTDAFWVSNQQPGSYGAGSQEPSGHGAGSQGPPSYGSGGQPSYGSGGQPSYGSGGQRSYGAESQQPPPYPGSWQPPGAGNWPPPPGSSFGQWGGSPQPPRRRGRRALAFAVVAIVGVGIGAAASFGIANNSSQQSPSTPGAQAVPAPNSKRAPLQNTGTSKLNVQAIAKAVEPSVVNVVSKLGYTNETAEGTGIVLSSSGLVLTNNHVIDKSTSVTAQIDGVGRTYTARVLGNDRTDDVALLQLQGASGLKAASFGDSSKVTVGDAVVALGNVGGQGGSPTVTSGEITAVNRSITAGDEGSSRTETLHGMLQTDAPIAAGDSGGPLVNNSGQVVGMDTAAASNNTGQSVSIGFAIPINHALSLAKDIAAGHSSSTIQIGARGFLGVGVADPSTDCQTGFGNFAPGGGGGGSGAFGGGSTAPASSGALVCQVYKGTPAQSAGVAAGDVITGVNGTTVASAQALTNAMKSQRPGNRVSLTWVDTSGQRHTATLTLAPGPAD